jgi:hypothetical protein
LCLKCVKPLKYFKYDPNNKFITYKPYYANIGIKKTKLAPQVPSWEGGEDYF